MGKIILSERQYRNLKNLLVEQATVPRTQYGSAKIDPKALTVTLTADMSIEDSSGTWGKYELKLFKGAVFKKNGTVIENNNTNFQEVTDYQGSVMAKYSGRVYFNCKNNLVGTPKIPGRSWKMDADVDTRYTLQGFQEICKSSGSAIGTSTGGNPIADKYWSLLKMILNTKYGAKTGGSGVGEFIYWGPWVFNKNLSVNGGWPITFGAPASNFWKFKGGTYAGQPIDNIILIDKGANQETKLVDVIAKGGKKTTQEVPKKETGTQEVEQLKKQVQQLQQQQQVQQKQQVVGGGGAPQSGGGSSKYDDYI